MGVIYDFLLKYIHLSKNDTFKIRQLKTIVVNGNADALGAADCAGVVEGHDYIMKIFL